MSEQTLANFVESVHDDVREALQDTNFDQVDPQYRLGVRRVAKVFFDNFHLFNIRQILPDLADIDVDAWYVNAEGSDGEHSRSP